MGCIIKIGNLSVSETDFLNHLNKIISVNKLFEENSDFSSKIYEALGFETTTSIPNYEVVTRPTKDIGKSKGRSGNFVEITTPDDYRTNMSAYMVQTNDDGKLFITNIEKYNEDSTFKGFGTVAYVDFFENYKNQGITTDKKLTADGIKLLERLEKIGLVYKTNAKLIDDTQVSKIYNTKIYEYDKPLYEFNLNWSRSQITPQQKQQAISIYSQYLEQNPNGSVEGFKEFVNNRQNNGIQLQDLSNNQVNYTLKVISIISNNLSTVNRWFKQLDNTDLFWNKVQQKLQIPKEQLELLKNSEGNTIEEKLLNFASKYSYVIEINTAKYISNIYKNPQNDFAIKDEYDNWIRYIFDGKTYRKDYASRYPNINIIISKDEFDTAKRKYIEDHTENSQHYADLTVPGGTNYTENEIATPLITPYIKGHAKFSTDNGIGWFRSDDKYPFTGFLEDLIASGTIKKVPCG